MLSDMGLVRMIHPDDLAPHRLLGAARDLLRHPETDCPRLEMTGLDNVVRAIDPLWNRPYSASA
jgi:predicted glycosyltransferase